MSKEVRQPKDELDGLLERLTLPAGFPDHVLREMLKMALELAPKNPPLELLNRLVTAGLKGVIRVPLESDSDIEKYFLGGVLKDLQADEDMPYAAGMCISAKSEEERSTKAKAFAIEFRKLLPTNVYVFIGPSEDGLPVISITRGKKLSEMFDKRKQGDVLILIQDDGGEELESLIDGESWDDCVSRINPQNNKSLILCSRAAQAVKECESFETAAGSDSEVLLSTHSGWKPQKPVTVGPKIGRNDPCPCGSGKKWKKCCMEAK